MKTHIFHPCEYVINADDELVNEAFAKLATDEFDEAAKVALETYEACGRKARWKRVPDNSWYCDVHKEGAISLSGGSWEEYE